MSSSLEGSYNDRSHHLCKVMTALIPRARLGSRYERERGDTIGGERGGRDHQPPLSDRWERGVLDLLDLSDLSDL